MMTTIFAGLATGAMYVIVAVGYNIVFVSSRVFNFAQAHFLTIGAFAGLFVGQALGLDAWLAVLLAALLAAFLGAVIGGLEEVLAIRRLLGRGEHNELVTTLGVGTIISGVALLIFGSDYEQLHFFDKTPFGILGGRLNIVDVLLIVVAVVMAVAVGIITKKSMMGLASLATSEDRQAGMLRGVNVRRLAFLAFVIAGALVAAAGPLVASKTFASFHLGDLMAVKAFVAVAIGGIGSYRGIVIGGFSVGLIEILAARFFGSDWQNIVVFVLLLLVLLLLPNGLFGRRNERVV